MLATPVTMVLLGITVIGLLAVPFLVLALMAAAAFGKIVTIAWIGSRLARYSSNDSLAHPAMTVLTGGLLLTLLYAVPVVGMIAFNVTGFVGLGVVVYALLLEFRQKRQGAAAAAAAPAPAPAPAAPGPAPAAEGGAPEAAAAAAGWRALRLGS